MLLFIYNHNGPGAVGNKIPTIVAAIHTMTAITNALSQPMLYKARNANNQTIPPTIAAIQPVPTREYTIV